MPWCRGLADCVPVIRGLVRVSFAAVVGREGVERPSGPSSDERLFAFEGRHKAQKRRAQRHCPHNPQQILVVCAVAKTGPL